MEMVYVKDKGAAPASDDGGQDEVPDFLLDRFALRVANTPNKTAFSFISAGKDAGEIAKSYTYSELDQRTSAVAGQLQKAG
eukprot:CAMPEP_0119550852 /NCGR_PEP_ID=MMETSP1352-20130426/4291_1 /TAXON_ID=265584 /ORGANISM="Stauroneis constricta, Strain CCMP1120" /LENGTH=80 /DNA_ID=CAMNT_0007596825 /DNA_START=47 /DNA_END=286 /DNA_ORIENTATION=+